MPACAELMETCSFAGLSDRLDYAAVFPQILNGPGTG